MNMTDGGKNRLPMRVIGLKGCRQVLQDLGHWREKMTLQEARNVLWQWEEVSKQMTRIEKLCYDHGVVLLYESKAHPVFNPTENWWRKSKHLTQNIFNFGELRDRYVELQGEHLSPSQAHYDQFAKWFLRAQTAGSYYARGGRKYLRDTDIKDLDFSELPRSWTHSPIRSFAQVSEVAHGINRILLRGKFWVQNQ